MHSIRVVIRSNHMLCQATTKPRQESRYQCHMYTLRVTENNKQQTQWRYAMQISVAEQAQEAAQKCQWKGLECRTQGKALVMRMREKNEDGKDRTYQVAGGDKVRHMQRMDGGCHYGDKKGRATSEKRRKSGRDEYARG